MRTPQIADAVVMDVSQVGPFSASSQMQTATLATLLGAQQMAKTGAALAQQVSADFGQTGGQAPGTFQTYA